MNNLTPLTTQRALRVLLLAGVLLTSSPALAADPESNTLPATLQGSAQPVPGADDRPGSDRNWLTDFGKKAFPLTVILVVFGWLGFSTWCDYQKGKSLLLFHHQERMAALEKGLELPPYPDGDSQADELAALQPDKPGRPLLIGLVWLFLGIGLAVTLAGINLPHASPAIGALPAGIGLAYLAYHFVEGRKSR